MTISIRDYTMGGPEATRARERGLVGATWYQTPLERRVLKDLMRREDGPSVRDAGLWLGLLVAFGGGVIALWGTWWVLLALAPYGLLAATAADSRWHESMHGTAFRTEWMNAARYQLCAFLLLANPVTTRWSHVRHHSDTIIVGQDPEIPAHRPPNLWLIAVNTFGLVAAPANLWTMLRLSAGRLSPGERDLVPESEHPHTVRAARLHLAVHAGVWATALGLGSWLPVVLVGLPRFYGIWLSFVVGVPQHLGLDEDVLDHRLNSRTILMGPVLRFFYSNMNYHVEHHMYPMVPWHRLPELHAAIRHDCPAPYPSVWAAWTEIIPTVLRQRRDPNHFAQREFPPGAGRTPAAMAA